MFAQQRTEVNVLSLLLEKDKNSHSMISNHSTVTLVRIAYRLTARS